MIDRRYFIFTTALVGLIGRTQAAWSQKNPFSVPAHAQDPSRVVRIGRLSPLSATADQPMMAGLKQGLAAHGWTEGRNIAFDQRVADGHVERLPALAAELVASGVDIIVAGSNPGLLAAKQATATIPIVFVTTADPVAAGLVASLGRPGANLTGIAALGQDLNAKRLQMLKETVPGLTRLAVPILDGSSYARIFSDIAPAAQRELGMPVDAIPIKDAAGIDAIFELMQRTGGAGVLIITEPLFLSNRGRIIELAARHRLPTMFSERESVEAGGLMSYGASLPALYVRAATFVDKILKGAKPADLPVEQPTKFELVINGKTAAKLGLTIPPTLLAFATEVIE